VTWFKGSVRPLTVGQCLQIMLINIGVFPFNSLVLFHLFQVSFSMLEIYNEQVKDLLVSVKQQTGGLKVRQHPKSGFYVDGLKV
jgi:Zn-dependent M16 (insulinase) family peptidase